MQFQGDFRIRETVRNGSNPIDSIDIWHSTQNSNQRSLNRTMGGHQTNILYRILAKKVRNRTALRQREL